MPTARPVGRRPTAGARPTTCAHPPHSPQIEHRLFAHITMNWRGRPLVSHQVIVELIGATTSRTGLTVRAEPDRGAYPLGVKVSDQELAAVPITRHEWHGRWNYTIHQPHSRARDQRSPAAGAGRCCRAGEGEVEEGHHPRRSFVRA